MTKGELRKMRKQERAEGRLWSAGIGEGGHLEQTRTRTRKEEQEHRDGWERWARRVQDRF